MESIDDGLEPQDGLQEECSVEDKGGSKLCAYAEKMGMSEEQYDKIKERAKSFAERRRRELAVVKEMMVRMYEELVRIGAYSKLSDETREFVDVYVRRQEKEAMRYPPNIYKMFAWDVRVGASCTLREAMQRLYRGKNEINFFVRRWNSKNGITIDIVPDENGSQLDSRYVISSMEGNRRNARHVALEEMLSDSEKEEARASRQKKIQGGR